MEVIKMAQEIIVEEVKEEKNKAKNKEVKPTSRKKQQPQEPKGTVATLLEKANEVEVKVDNAPTTKPTTMVRILMKEDHRCNIGGNWYCFTKGKHYNVPENVKNILMRANKLLPL